MSKKSNRTRGVQKEEKKMSQEEKVKKLSTTAAAFFAALADFLGSVEVTAAEPVAKPAPAAKKKAEEKKADEPKVEEKKPAEGGDLMEKCREAAQGYAGVYGREGLRKILDKYVPGKPMADVPADKLPDLLKDLS